MFRTLVNALRLTDHRGRRVRLIALASARREGMLRIEQKQFVSDTADRAVADTYLVILGGLMGAGLIVIASTVVSKWGALGTAFLGIYAAMCAYVLYTVNRRMLAREMITLYLSNRRCPSCAYSMQDLTLEPDGCVTCPECGSAWCLPQEPRELFP